jgi:hypothetical protein
MMRGDTFRPSLMPAQWGWLKEQFDGIIETSKTSGSKHW